MLRLSLRDLPFSNPNLVNEPIASSESLSRFWIDSNSVAISPLNFTDVPNIALRELWAFIRPSVLFIISFELIAISFISDERPWASLYEIPNSLAVSPEEESIILKASTNCWIAKAIKAAGPKLFIKLEPNCLAKWPAACILETFPSPAATMSLVLCNASPKPNLVSRAPNPAFFKPALNPSVKAPNVPVVSSIVFSFCTTWDKVSSMFW